jgi:hypothetical protein
VPRGHPLFSEDFINGYALVEKFVRANIKTDNTYEHLHPAYPSELKRSGISNLNQTLMGAAKLAFWAGMDSALRYHCRHLRHGVL